MDIAITRWRGAGGPSLLAVHATGFCKETWGPVVDELRSLGFAGDVVALDQRGHGDSDVHPPPYDWRDLGRDVLAVVAAEGPFHLGVGHSSGAAALLIAETLRPGTFPSLVLVEPIVFPPPHARVESHPLTEGALRRKAAFPSREDALANYRDKDPFATWDERALLAYVDHGFRAEMGEWVLKCPPRVEADFYRGANDHDTWERLTGVNAAAHVVGGADSPSHPPPVIAAFAAQLPAATTEIVAGATHFVPMEQPARLAASILAQLGVTGS